MSGQDSPVLYSVPQISYEMSSQCTVNLLYTMPHTTTEQWTYIWGGEGVNIWTEFMQFIIWSQMWMQNGLAPPWLASAGCALQFTLLQKHSVPTHPQICTSKHSTSWNSQSVVYHQKFTMSPFKVAINILKRCWSDRMLWAVVISRCGRWSSQSPVSSVWSTSLSFRYMSLLRRYGGDEIVFTFLFQVCRTSGSKTAETCVPCGRRKRGGRKMEVNLGILDKGHSR